MIDNSETNPDIIRATYAARGKNRKLNIQKAESLGMDASEIDPVRRAASGSTAGTQGFGGSGDPTTASQGTTYEGGGNDFFGPRGPLEP